MPHLRIFRHYVHTPFLMMSALEAVVLFGAALAGYWWFGLHQDAMGIQVLRGVLFVLVMLAAMAAMGVYESRVREGYSAMMLRTAVALFLLGPIGLALVAAVVPRLVIPLGTTLYVSGCAFLLLAALRLLTPRLFPEDSFKQRVIVLGVGARARKIAARMRRRSDQRAFVLHGFLDNRPGAGNEVVTDYGARVLRSELPLYDFCREHQIDEIVVAVDERRRGDDGSGGIPLDQLMDCRLSGIRVCDVQQFIEREACKVDVDLLRPSWLVFSDGFIASPARAFTKRTFDLLVSSVLLLVLWPVMLLIAAAIWLDSGLRGTVLLRQERVGLNGRTFNLLKFRSMVPDAEADGPVWARRNEDRVTRIGGFLRKSRLDELPQLFNVLKGEMSFVGPRPERPVFVHQLAEQIPFYGERHRVKPGITGWAQLCYPYGASVEDAKEKLQYDLYYLKNQGILLDLIILLQTVEVVLIGEGAR